LILALAEALTVEPLPLLVLPNGVDLKALRLASGLSAAELAQAAHVSLRSDVRWEPGENQPLDNDRILSALAQALDTSPIRVVWVLHPRSSSPGLGPLIGELTA
jgi:transcriptional regulator with XRE-family HTH domain